MEETLLQQEQKVGCFYLRFETEESFLTACEEAGFITEQVAEWDTTTDEEGVETKTPKSFEKVFIKECLGYNFDIIGIIFSNGVYETDETTGETVTLVEPIQKQGFHVNYEGILPASFEAAVLPEPQNPHRALRGFAPPQEENSLQNSDPMLV